MKTKVYLLVSFYLLFLSVAVNPAIASSTVLGSTDAMMCYEQSKASVSIDSLVHCNNALLKGRLSKHDLAATYSNRGLIYSKLSKFEKALKDHNKAIELRPELAPAYVNRGNTFYRLKSFEDAIEDYEKAIVLGGGPVHIALYNKGMVYLKIRNKREAEAAFRKALEIYPESKMIRSRLESLKN